LDFVARNVPGGIKCHNEAFGDPRLATFFEQSFLASTWYDVYPLVRAGSVCADLLGLTLPQLLRARGKDQVARDLTGVYGFLARFASQRLVARGVVDAVERYFEFAVARSEQVNATHVRTYISGVPEELAEWMAALAQSYSEATFEHVGAHDVRVRVQRLPCNDRKNGVPLAEIVVDIRWDGNAAA
jgi:hypothetical protein